MMGTHKICPAAGHAGPRWVSVLNFGVERWDAVGLHPLVLHGWCQGCKARWARGYNARMRALEASGDARGVAWAAQRRATNREANITRERKNGAVPRHELGGGGRRLSVVDGSTASSWATVPMKWFDLWLSEVGQYTDQMLKDELGVRSGLWKRIRHGRQVSGTITLGSVDAVLCALGRPGAYEDVVSWCGSAGLSWAAWDLDPSG